MVSNVIVVAMVSVMFYCIQKHTALEQVCLLLTSDNMPTSLKLLAIKGIVIIMCDHMIIITTISSCTNVKLVYRLQIL